MKRTLILMLGLCMIFLCTACGNTSNDESKNTEQNIVKSTGWETIRVKTILPQPKSQNWKIFSNEDDYLDINIFDTSLEDYNAYIASCEDYGFEMYIFDNTDENEYECEGYNKYHSEIDINYDFDRQTMHLQLDASIEKNPLKWSTSELAQMLPVPDNAKGYIDADKEEKYEVILMDVSISDFNTYVDGCIEKGFTIDSQNYSTYYRANNQNGYRVTIEYAEMSHEMGITLITPEAQ